MKLIHKLLKNLSNSLSFEYHKQRMTEHEFVDRASKVWCFGHFRCLFSMFHSKHSRATKNLGPRRFSVLEIDFLQFAQSVEVGVADESFQHSLRFRVDFWLWSPLNTETWRWPSEIDCFQDFQSIEVGFAVRWTSHCKNSSKSDEGPAKWRRDFIPLDNDSKKTI